MESAVPVLAYASWPRRLLSGVIDSAVISFISGPFTGAASHHLFDAISKGTKLGADDVRTLLLVNLVVTVVYMTAFHSWSGSTLGKMAARTVLVNEDGTKVTPQVAFVRAVTLAAIQFVSTLLLAPLIVNELRPLWSPRRQTWHDAVAKTVVVSAGSLPDET
ncbi:MAG: hypothetical protein QOJ00_2874 [Actinomycetota bacterium]